MNFFKNLFNSLKQEDEPDFIYLNCIQCGSFFKQQSTKLMTEPYMCCECIAKLPPPMSYNQILTEATNANTFKELDQLAALLLTKQLPPDQLAYAKEYFTEQHNRIHNLHINNLI